MVKKEIHKKVKLSAKELSKVTGGVSGIAPSGARFYTALGTSPTGSTAYEFNWVIGGVTRTFPCTIKSVTSSTTTSTGGVVYSSYEKIVISKTALGTSISASDLTWLGDLSKHANFVVKLTT